tara:strand:+ start:3820 stop:4248 length:429 start_codon:yes stop_codon:yes gene_type:complete
MTIDHHLKQQLEEIIESGLVEVPIPYQKGNSIRIRHIVIRNHHNGYRIFNIKSNKHVCTTFSKTAALAIAKMSAENTPFNLKDIQKLDDKVTKHYMDAVYAKRAMETADSDERKDSAEVRFDIATENAWTALADIERYIFDK